MELKNVILFILLVLTIIAMSFSNLTGSDSESSVDPVPPTDAANEDAAEVVLTSERAS